MTSLFQRNLDRIRDEILALKTAHNRGLDTTRFYKYKLSIYGQAMEYYDFRATIADGEPENPIITPLIYVGGEPVGANIIMGAITATKTEFSVFSGWESSGQIEVAVISSSRLKEFRQI